jgi:hypothetical protein
MVMVGKVNVEVKKLAASCWLAILPVAAIPDFSPKEIVHIGQSLRRRNKVAACNNSKHMNCGNRQACTISLRHYQIILHNTFSDIPP